MAIKRAATLFITAWLAAVGDRIYGGDEDAYRALPDVVVLP